MPVLTPTAVRFPWEYVEGDKLQVVFIRTTDDADDVGGTPEPFEDGTTGLARIKRYRDDPDDETLVYLAPIADNDGDGTVEVVPGSVDPYEAAQVVLTVDAGVIVGLGVPRAYFSVKIFPGGRVEDGETFAHGLMDLTLLPTSGD